MKENQGNHENHGSDKGLAKLGAATNNPLLHSLTLSQLTEEPAKAVKIENEQQ